MSFGLLQESVIVLAKLMLPHMFEKMSMQDLRTLIAERSTMNIYIRGENVELLHHAVGILLEGFIKLQGAQEELLTAPAAILPRVNQVFCQSETLGTQLVTYQLYILLMISFIHNHAASLYMLLCPYIFDVSSTSLLTSISVKS